MVKNSFFTHFIKLNQTLLEWSMFGYLSNFGLTVNMAAMTKNRNVYCLFLIYYKSK